jgi:acyl-CoA synthetase (AMP-forming)/AMP-acid ligase II
MPDAGEGDAVISELLSRLNRDDAGIEFHGERGGVEWISFAQLGAQLREEASRLQRSGVSPRDAVAIAMRADRQHVVAFLALLWLGAVPVSIKTPRTWSAGYASYVDRICERFGVRHVMQTGLDAKRTAPLVLSRRSECASRASCTGTSQPALAFVQFSSGSIKEPKPVPVTETALAANISEILRHDARQPHTVMLSFMPLSHDMGLVGGLLSCLWLQNPLILVEIGAFLMRPFRVLDHAHLRGASVTMLPEFAMRHLTRLLLRQERGACRTPCFAAYRSIYCGSEPIRHETVAAFLRVGQNLGLQAEALTFCYGLAEATLMVTGHRFAGFEASFDASYTKNPVARLGLPIEDLELAIDEQSGVPGEVLLRGSSVFNGYWHEPARQRDEWFATGDLGYLAAGELHLCGRRNDRISVNGEVIFATDLESEILESAAVRDCLVLPEENGLSLLIVPRREGERMLPEINTMLARQFGVVARAIVIGKSRDILRTTSGKPRRAATRAALGHRLPAEASQ